MPLVRIDLTHGHTPETLSALGDAVQHALVATFNVPEADRFQVISEHPPGHGLVITPSFLGVDHRPQALFVQITAAVRAEDVVINLTEVQRVDWSFGNGIAQYVPEG